MPPRFDCAPELGPVRPRRIGSLEIPFVYVPTGAFWMGAPLDGADPDDQQPAHLVRIAHPLWVACAPLTEAEAAGLRGDAARRRRTRSAATFLGSWLDAVALCGRASALVGCAPALVDQGRWPTPDWYADGFRLMTEAEWEYVARGAEAAGAPASFLQAGGGRVEWVLDGFDHDAYLRDAERGIVTHPVHRMGSGRRVVRGGVVWRRYDRDATDDDIAVRLCCRAPGRSGNEAEE